MQSFFYICGKNKKNLKSSRLYNGLSYFQKIKNGFKLAPAFFRSVDRKLRLPQLVRRNWDSILLLALVEGLTLAAAGKRIAASARFLSRRTRLSAIIQATSIIKSPMKKTIVRIAPTNRRSPAVSNMCSPDFCASSRKLFADTLLLSGKI